MTGRRGNREGSIYPEPDGGYRVEVTYVDVRGRSRRVRQRAQTKTEANRKLRAMQALAREGTPAGDAVLTVEGYWKQWRSAGLRSGDRKRSTVELYTKVMNCHVLPAVGQQRLARLSPDDVEAMLADMVRQRATKGGKVGETVSGQTKRTAYAVLTLMLDSATRAGLVSRNVCEDVPRPRPGTQEAEHLGADGLRLVLTAVRGNRLEPLVTLLAATGVRVGEGLAVRWQDVDVDDGEHTLRVTGTVHQSGGHVDRTSTKSGRARVLPLDDATAATLRAWRARQHAERLRAGTTWEGDGEGWVFTTESGRLLDYRNALRGYTRALRGTGLPARFHVLRHSVATAMLVEGRVPTLVVSSVLGHSSERVTTGVYGHVRPDAQRAALAGVAALVRDETPPGTPPGERHKIIAEPGNGL